MALTSGGGGGLANSSGTATSLAPNATGSTLVLSGSSTALQFISTQAASSDGYKVTTNGVRWHIGTGSFDYISSDGTTITFRGPLAITDGADLTVGAGGSDILGVRNVVASGQFKISSYTDDSANPGNRTVNTVRGKNAIAAGAAACTITNSFVTANSQVICCLEFADATLNTIRTVIPGAGSFVITCNANATANTKFSWLVINST